MSLPLGKYAKTKAVHSHKLKSPAKLGEWRNDLSHFGPKQEDFGSLPVIFKCAFLIAISRTFRMKVT